MPRSELTHARLRFLLSYDPEAGEFTRQVATGRHGRWRAGEPVTGKPMKAGHLRIMVDGVHYLSHRLAWFYMTGEWPQSEIDHRDRNPSNNRWSNLRAADKSKNGQNRGLRRNNTSGVTGVCWVAHSKKWRAEINSEPGKRKNLGSFDSLECAAQARRSAEAIYFGEFAPSHTTI